CALDVRDGAIVGDRFGDPRAHDVAVAPVECRGKTAAVVPHSTKVYARSCSPDVSAPQAARVWWRRRESKSRRLDAQNPMRDANLPRISLQRLSKIRPAVSRVIPYRTASIRRFMATVWQ